MPHAEPAQEPSPEAPCSNSQQPVATDDNPLQPDSAALTKPEACKLLGKSERTVNTYMADGRIAFRLIGGKAHFDRAVVERLKADLATPVVRGVQMPAPLAVSNDASLVPARTDPPLLGRGDQFAVLTALLTRLETAVATATPSPVIPGTFVSLAEAVKCSGLPASYLLSQARAGVPWAINVGTGKKAFWRFCVDAKCPAALRVLADSPRFTRRARRPQLRAALPLEEAGQPGMADWL
jgi:hypothetical protein